MALVDEPLDLTLESDAEIATHMLEFERDRRSPGVKRRLRLDRNRLAARLN